MSNYNENLVNNNNILEELLNTVNNLPDKDDTSIITYDASITNGSGVELDVSYLDEELNYVTETVSTGTVWEGRVIKNSIILLHNMVYDYNGSFMLKVNDNTESQYIVYGLITHDSTYMYAVVADGMKLMSLTKNQGDSSEPV